MLERLMKYWPVITASAFAIVSVFNIGYFSIVGLHFVGVMDLSNVIYAVGLVFGFLIIPVAMLPDGLLDLLREIASLTDLPLKLERARKGILGFFGLSFFVALIFHKPFISITGLFALYFAIAWLVFAAITYVLSTNRGTPPPPRVMMAGIAFGLFTIFWIGAAVAYHEAFGSNTLYTMAAKDAVYDNVRIARSSSNGFLIARDKRIMYVPSGEVKSISQINPVDDNKP